MLDYNGTVKDIFGEKKHYRNGKLIGESWPGLFGGSWDHYDDDGYAGSTVDTLFGETTELDMGE